MDAQNAPTGLSKTETVRTAPTRLIVVYFQENEEDQNPLESLVTD